MQRQTNFLQTVSDKGIDTISDLITEERKFLRWSHARDKYQLSSKDVMKWLGLIESIHRDWKSFIKSESNGFNRTYSISNDIRALDKTIPLQAITSRIAYTLLTKPLIEKPTAQKSISELLCMSDINWKVVYQLPHRVTNETSLGVFQYKILNNILHLNNRLHKFGFVESLCVLYATENQRAFCIHFATVRKLRNYGNQFNTGAKTISVCHIGPLSLLF